VFNRIFILYSHHFGPCFSVQTASLVFSIDTPLKSLEEAPLKTRQQHYLCC